jgi:hypothetical protein
MFIDRKSASIYFNLLVKKEKQPFADITTPQNMSNLSAIGIAVLMCTPLKVFEKNVFSSPRIMYLWLGIEQASNHMNLRLVFHMGQ